MRLYAVCLGAALLAACDNPSSTTAPPPSGGAAMADAETRDASALAFGPQARPYGHSMVFWSQRYWRWAYSIPASDNPLVDGGVPHDCEQHQHGHVWNLPVLIAPTTSGTQSCTIPADKALVVNMSGVLNDFPCPDTSFHPAPGQSLYSFLAAGAAAITSTVQSLALTVDGASIPDLLQYNFVSPQLFDIRGNLTLQTVLDPCITGSPQPAVSNALMIVLKPLSPGHHVVVSSATDAMGTTTDTYNLTIRSEDDGDDGD